MRHGAPAPGSCRGVHWDPAGQKNPAGRTFFWYWDLKNSLCQSASKNRPKRRSGEKLHASVPPGPASGSHVTDALHGASQHHVQLKFGRFGNFLQTWHAKMRRAHAHAFRFACCFAISVGFHRGCRWPTRPRQTPPSRRSSLRSRGPRPFARVCPCLCERASGRAVVRACVRA